MRTPESPKADGCLPTALAAMILTAAILEREVFHSERIFNFLQGEGKRKKYYEAKQLDETEQRKLEEIIERYAAHLALLSIEPNLILPEEIRAQYTSLIEDTEAQIEDLLEQTVMGQDRFDKALLLLSQTEARSLRDQSSQYVWPLISQLRGQLHEAIANDVESLDAQHYWLALAIHHYVRAHQFDQFATDGIVENPIRIIELLQRMHQFKLARMLQHA